MSDLNKVGDQDGWRCWLCDQPVDADASVNSDLGPSVDSYALAKAAKGSLAAERLAHRACNTMKGAGQDVQKVGEKVEEKAEECKDAKC